MNTLEENMFLNVPPNVSSKHGKELESSLAILC
jgi:hypothetical protein